MENYVVSRVLAEKLEAAGYPDTTQFVLFQFWADETKPWKLELREKLNFEGEYGVKDYLPMPLSDELLEQVRMFDFTVVNLNSNTLSLTSDSLDDPEAAIFGKNHAELLANFWLVLKEEGHIK